MGAVQGFNGPPSPARARETLLNTPLGVTALSQPQPEHGSAPSRGRPIVPRARLLKRRGASRLSAAPTPNSSPQFSPAPYPINVWCPSQSRGPGVSPLVHPPPSAQPVCAQGLYQANPISGRLPPAPPQSPSPRPIRAPLSAARPANPGLETSGRMGAGRPLNADRLAN